MNIRRVHESTKSRDYMRIEDQVMKNKTYERFTRTSAIGTLCLASLWLYHYLTAPKNTMCRSYYAYTSVLSTIKQYTYDTIKDDLQSSLWDRKTKGLLKLTGIMTISAATCCYVYHGSCS